MDPTITAAARPSTRKGAYTSPFPPVLLPREDLAALRQMAYAFVTETCEQFEGFIRVNEDRRLPKETWKLLHEVEDTRIYAERKSATRRTGEAAGWDILLGVGSTVGNLDDCMYGVINPSVDQMRIKSAYCKDTLVDGAVLATLEQPSVDDPFRTMNLRWFVKAFPAYMRPLARNRDFVYVEATGITSFSDGERVGYHLLHSVSFPQFPALDDYVRADVHIMALWRQRTPDRVEVYMRTFMDFKMKIMASLAVRSVGQAIMCVARYVHAAQMKKLAWTVRRRVEERAQRRVQVRESFMRETHCVTCGKEVSTTLFSRTKKMCHVCGHAMCPTCSIKKTIYLIRTSGELGSYRPTVCVACLREAVTADAVHVAGDEVLEKTQQGISGELPFVREESSSSSTPETESIFSSEADPDYPLLSPSNREHWEVW